MGDGRGMSLSGLGSAADRNVLIPYFQAGLRMGWLALVFWRAALTSLVKGESGGETSVRRLRVVVASGNLRRLAWA